MLDTSIIRRFAVDPQGLAAYYTAEYVKKHEMTFPVNPFQLLRDAGVHFMFRDYKKLEGTFLPATGADDIDLVSINAKRPIARQRYTAAHELCHFLKDSKPSACETDSKDDIERYAERFAAALLMPQSELKLQIATHLSGRHLVNDDILLIAEYFGTSFAACTYRICDLFQDVLRERPTQISIRQYHPMNRRKELGLDDTRLLADLVDVWDDITWQYDEGFARRVFEHEYVYNDTRLEGINVDAEAVAEIVTDLRMHTQHSRFCSEAYQNYCHIAGHAAMYQKAFAQAHDPQLTIYQLLSLHQQLYSCFPEPSFGGKLRQENTLVLKAKFETLDYTEVSQALAALEMDLHRIE
jgi:Zn-dependent peptidase ImmA (M78 family)